MNAPDGKIATFSLRAGKSLTRESLEKALEERGVVLQKLEFEERPRAAAAYVIGVPEANISWLPRFGTPGCRPPSSL